MADPMNYSCQIDGTRTDDTGRLKALLLDELEGERSPPEGKSKFDEIRDGGRFLQVRALTPEKLRHMTQVEKRLLHAWVVRITDEFDVKANLISENMGAEPDLPAIYRANGAA